MLRPQGGALDNSIKHSMLQPLRPSTEDLTARISVSLPHPPGPVKLTRAARFPFAAPGQFAYAGGYPRGLECVRFCPLEPSVASRANICANASRRSWVAFSVARAFTAWAVALALSSDSQSSGCAVVERPQFFPRFLRTHVFRFCRLAGTPPAGHLEAAALMVGPLASGVWFVHAGGRPAGR